MKERLRSLVNAMLVSHAVNGRPLTAAEMGKALRIKATIHTLKRNGSSNMRGKSLRMMTYRNAVRKDLI